MISLRRIYTRLTVGYPPAQLTHSDDLLCILYIQSDSRPTPPELVLQCINRSNTTPHCNLCSYNQVNQGHSLLILAVKKGPVFFGFD